MAVALPMAMQPVEQATTKTLLQSGVQRSRFMLFFLAGLATWYALLRIAQEDPTVLFFTDGDPRNHKTYSFLLSLLSALHWEFRCLILTVCQRTCVTYSV